MKDYKYIHLGWGILPITKIENDIIYEGENNNQYPYIDFEKYLMTEEDLLTHKLEIEKLNNNNRREIKIFECLLEMCMSEGGDGDSILVSINFREWADKFEVFLKNLKKSVPYIDFKKNREINYTIFVYNQECIWFTDPDIEKTLPSYVGTGGKIVLMN